MRSSTFLKSERLLNRKEFVNLNRRGRRLQTDHFSISLMKNGQGFTRLGITVSKRVGNSVRRNRVKRLIREYFRLHKAFLPQGCDLVIVARKNADGLDFWKMKAELDEPILDKSFRLLS
ncbi:MAG: ribonuclease P protein component [Thermodesulfobacteriota bacterium]